MSEKDQTSQQAFDALHASIKAVTKSVDSLSVKLDGITNIAMNMSNEIARLDERVTFALDQQKSHAADMAEIKRRITTLESNDTSDEQFKSFAIKVFLVVFSAVVTGIVMYFTGGGM